MPMTGRFDTAQGPGDPNFAEAAMSNAVNREKAITADQNRSRDRHADIINRHLQFPAGLGVGEGDLLNWMKFQAFEISGGFSETKMVQFSNSGLGFAALPIPAGINASYDQSWNQASVSAKSQTIARGVETLAGGPKGIANFIKGGEFDVGGLGGIGERFGQQFGGMSFGQEATAALLKSTGVAETMQFTMGMRALDQVMMSYGGPGFRNFNFTFALKPLNIDDSVVIDQIIQFFKIASAPFKLQTQMTRLYDLPNVFKISFHNGNSENTWLPKIGHCALTNVGVTFGGDKFTTFDGTLGMPVQTDLTLSFKEMELIDRDHFVKDPMGGGGEGGTQVRVADPFSTGGT